MKPPRHFLRRLLRRLGIGTLLGIGIPILLAMIYLRFFGLPEVAKVYLLDQIQQRHILPFPVDVTRLLLSPTGAVLADRLTVYRDTERQSILIQVDQLRISLAWFSWWRGRGLIDSASISNATVRYPIGPDQTIDFHEVNAEVSFDGKDIKIEDAEARFLNLAVSVRGVIHNDGFPEAKAPTPEQIAARQDIWRAALTAMDDIGTQQPIDVQLEFASSTRDLGNGHANFALDGRHLTWRSAPVEEFSIHGSLSDGIVSLSDFKIGLGRGELSAYGEWNLAGRSAELQFTSTMDFTTLSPAFPGPLGQALSRLEFPNSPPMMTGRVLFDLEQGFKADVQANLDWRSFVFNGSKFERLSIPLAYDGHRLLIPGLKLDGDVGDVNLELFFDGAKTAPSLKAKITSNLDPTILKGVFGEGMDNFLSSCSFQEGGPKIEATATGSALKTAAWTVKGKITADKFVYKTAAFNQATADFTFADSKLNMPNLQLHRTDGNGGGGIIYDFKNRSVELKNLTAQVNVQEVAPVMGPKFVLYTKPYIFSSPPFIRANGTVDLQSDKKDLTTDLLVEIQGKSPMEWTLFHIPYIFEKPSGQLIFKNRRLVVDMKQTGFYGGTIAGLIDMDLRAAPAGYTLDLKLDKVDFRRFMKRTWGYDKSTGQLDVQAKLGGYIGKMETMTGKGEVRVEDGDITQIPFLGSLTPLIPGFTAADAARGHFTIAKGLVMTEDMNINSETLALIGKGNYNFITDDLDLDMRVNANNLPGILLYPISKIFEYNGTGKMKDPKWVPKNF